MNTYSAIFFAPQSLLHNVIISRSLDDNNDNNHNDVYDDHNDDDDWQSSYYIYNHGTVEGSLEIWFVCIVQ